MATSKNKSKINLKSRINQRFRLKPTLVIAGTMFGLTVVIVGIINSTSPLLMLAREDNSINVVQVEDQSFTTQNSLELPEIKPEIKVTENTIFIKTRKAINAQ